LSQSIDDIETVGGDRIIGRRSHAKALWIVKPDVRDMLVKSIVLHSVCFVRFDLRGRHVGLKQHKRWVGEIDRMLLCRYFIYPPCY